MALFDKIEIQILNQSYRIINDTVKIYIINLIDNAEDQYDWLSLVPCYTNYIILIDSMN